MKQLIALLAFLSLAVGTTGAIDGVWLYTFAKLNHMDWDENGDHVQYTPKAGETARIEIIL